MRARPPTTPPTIGPTGEECDDPEELDEVAFGVEAVEEVEADEGVTALPLEATSGSVLSHRQMKPRTK